MEKTKINLKKGFVEVYNFGEIKLHSYQTNDLMNDESYILENKDNVLLLMTNFIKLDLIKRKYLLYKEVIDIFNVV